jgi:hypothetical protein
MKQSAVSRIEQAHYAAWNLTTLFRAGEALNARWRIVLEPLEEAIKEYIPKAEDAYDEQLNGDAARAAARAARHPRELVGPAAAKLRDDDVRFNMGTAQ